MTMLFMPSGWSYLSSMQKELVGVRGITASKRQRCSCHSCSRFTGQIRSWPLWSDCVGRAACGHVFRPLPAQMIGISIPHLYDPGNFFLMGTCRKHYCLSRISYEMLYKRARQYFHMQAFSENYLQLSKRMSC